MQIERYKYLNQQMLRGKRGATKDENIEFYVHRRKGIRVAPRLYLANAHIQAALLTYECTQIFKISKNKICNIQVINIFHMVLDGTTKIGSCNTVNSVTFINK